MRFIISALWLIGVAFLTGCEKEEQPLQLPASEVFAGSVIDRVNMGPEYATQIFYGFSGHKAVHSGPCDAWDLAFESGADGIRVFMNGGAKEGGTQGNIAVYNTGQRHFASVTTLPAGFQSAHWRYDDPSGNRDSTGVGEWRNLTTASKSKEDVYIIRTGSGGGRASHKMQILASTAQKWTIGVGLLAASQPIVLDLPKDTARNFIYYSFRDGIVATVEPPKATKWDVVFTRYRYLYRDLNNFPYTVTGVLVNPAGTSVAVDSVSLWENIDASHAVSLAYTVARDAIGWNWKTIGSVNGQPGGSYTIDTRKVFVVRTASGKLFKLRFLDFYSPSGEKGSPTFEYKQLQ